MGTFAVTSKPQNIMKLITSEEILQKFIPNIIQVVKGEIPLIEKIAPFLDIAEEWLQQTFTSEPTFTAITGYSDANIIKTYAAKVVVCEAFRNAIPSLDLVLTPNGFGIVSNSNIAPASKDRVNRLMDSLEAERDAAIRLLIPSLVGASRWKYSKQYDFFSATLFPNLDICDYLGYTSHQWQHYLEIRPTLLEIEEYIAVHFIGHKEYENFRQHVIFNDSPDDMIISVIRSLRACEAQMLKDRLSNTSPSRRTPPTTLVEIVNIIRDNPYVFDIWHSSPIAELYKPAIFENKKKDKGYWF